MEKKAETTRTTPENELPNVKSPERHVKKFEDPIKSMNFFKRLKLIKGTLSKLRERTSFRKFMFVKNHQLKIINDYTFDGEGRQDVDLLKSFGTKKNTGSHWPLISLVYGFELFKKLSRKILDVLEEGIQRMIPTIKPNSKKKILWDIFIMFFILFKFFMIPIELSFGIKLHINVDPSFGLVNFLTSCFFIMDIFLKMNTGFYENGNVVLVKSKILKHYFHSYFILDMLASVHSGKYIYEYIYTLSSNKMASSAPWLHVFFFFKLIELMHVVSNLEESIYMSETMVALTELVKLVVKIVFYSHLEACIWHATAHFNEYSGENWIEKAGMSEAHWFDRYLVSLFWSISSLITASYGEKVSPQNRLEMIIGGFLLLVGAMVFGYTIKSVGEVLDRLNDSKKTFKNKLRTLNRFMQQKNIDYELQDRARKYLHFFLRDRESENAKRVEEILDKFSFNLKEEIYLNTNGIIIQGFPILKENFSNEFLKKLVFQMTQVSFIPEETIFLENDLDEQNLYLITEGVIHLYHEHNKRVTLLKEMTAGNSFGEKEFFSGGSRCFSAKSITFSSGYCIKKEHFITTIQKFPEDYERFCMVKDEILIYNETNSLRQKCFSCNMIGHDYTQCRKIKYIPFKDFVIRRSQFSKPQERDIDFRRKKKGKFNSRFNKRTVRNQVQEFLMNTSDIFSDYLTLTDDNEEEEFEESELYEDLGEGNDSHLKKFADSTNKANEAGNKSSISRIDECKADNSEHSINNESSVGLNMNKIKNKTPKIFDDLNLIKKSENHLIKSRPETVMKDSHSDMNNSFKSKSEISINEKKKIIINDDKKLAQKHQWQHSLSNNFNQNGRNFTFDNKNIPEKAHLFDQRKNSKIGNISPANEPRVESNDHFTCKEASKSNTQTNERINTITNKFHEMKRASQNNSGFLNFGVAVHNPPGQMPEGSIEISNMNERTTNLKSEFTGINDNGVPKEENLFLLEFERVKSYSKYFNNNNMENVIKEIELREKMEKKRKTKSKYSHISLKNMENPSFATKNKFKRRKSIMLSKESITSSKKEKIIIYEI